MPFEENKKENIEETPESIPCVKGGVGEADEGIVNETAADAETSDRLPLEGKVLPQEADGGDAKDETSDRLPLEGKVPPQEADGGDAKDETSDRLPLEGKVPPQEADGGDAKDELFQYGEEKKKKSGKRKKTSASGFRRKFAPLIALGVAALLLCGIYVLLRIVAPTEKDPDSKVNPVTVTQITPSSVRRVNILNAGDEYALVKKSGSVYYIEGKEDKEVDSDVILTSIEKLSSISSIKKIGVDEKKLEEYGLKNPQGRAEIVLPDSTVTLYFGNRSADEKYYYALKLGDEKEDGKTAVYLVEAETAEIVGQDRFYYYQQNISGYDANSDSENITPVIIGGTQGTHVTVRGQQESKSEDVTLTYMMTEPIRMPFSTAVMTSVLDLLSTLNDANAVDDDVTPAHLDTLGLKTPAYTLEFGNNTALRTILFGKVTDTSIYCMKKDGSAVYTIPAGSVACLGLDLADMCDVITYTRDVNTVTGITVAGQNKRYDIKLVGKDDERVVYVNNKNVERSIFSEFYAAILGVEVKQQGKKPTGAPYLTITMTLENGGAETLAYYEVNERFCYYELDGTGMFYVSHEAVDSLLSNAQKLYENKEISAAW